jgi:hypothetical protein
MLTHGCVIASGGKFVLEATNSAAQLGDGDKKEQVWDLAR